MTLTQDEAAEVLHPWNAGEVADAVRRAVRDGLEVAVRSGGHSRLLGLGADDGAVVVDLRHLDAVELLDAQCRVVRVGAGATWGRVAVALAPYGLALTSGDTSSVGVGGLTLGGGIGWMVRKYGLTVDSLVAARVVTADGRLVMASADEHPELFWALRGGGGNFGVVVDLDFVAQPVTTVHFGTVTYRVDDVADLVRRWRDAMRAAPDELSSTLALLPGAPGGPRQAFLLLCYAGEGGTSVAEADRAIEPLLELGVVTEAAISERPYADVLEDGQQLPPGLRMVVRNTLVPRLDEDVVGAIAALHGTGGTMLALRSLGGAVGRVPADATAFAHRDAEAMVVCGLALPSGATPADVERALQPWRPVAGLGTGAYVNFQGSATAADVAAVYPHATYARLAAVKRAYDPGNVFARNHNVVPG